MEAPSPNGRAGPGVPDVPVVPVGRQVELAGGRKTFVREAEGPPGAPTVLLLHGLGATGGLNWAGAFAALGRHFRVVAIDHRGHGRGIRTARFRLADCAEDAYQLTQALDIDQCIPVGYSMGGPIAMLMWRRHPEVVRGLVLVATSRNFRGRPVEKLGFAALALAAASPLPLPLPDVPLKYVWRGIEPLAGLAHVSWGLQELQRHQPHALIQAAAELGRFSCHDWARQVDVPVAIVATTQDRMVPLTRQVRLASALPTAVLHPLDAGHLTAGPRWSAAALEILVDACREADDRAGRWAQPAPRRRAGAAKTA